MIARSHRSSPPLATMVATPRGLAKVVDANGKHNFELEYRIVICAYEKKMLNFVFCPCLQQPA